MQQSNVIFGTFFVAFLIFITLRGELPAYIDILRGGGGQTTSSTTSSTVTGSSNALSNAGASLINSGNPVTDLLNNSQSLGIPAINGSSLLQ